MTTNLTTPPIADSLETAMVETHPIALLTIKTVQHYDGPLDTQLPIYPDVDIWVGRDESKCFPFFGSNIVSSKHFRIYSVIYDDERMAEFPPLIYCEDRDSTNGTYVNDTLIGKFSSPRSPCLLNDGDVISIRPYWTFHFSQESVDQANPLDGLQTQEIELFKDRYDVSHKLLGSGIYGTVFLANEVGTQKQMACKIVDLRREALRPEMHVGNHDITKVQAIAAKHKNAIDVREKLFREIEILSKLSHPNIVTLYKAFRSPHSLYIFSELAAGGDLFSFLLANGPCLDDLHTRIICRQVTIAVDYLHSQGIAHRDLKPENILVMRRGIGHRVVLTDFGCAGYTNTASGRMMSTVGTFDFVAPEVHKTKSRGYTEAIDMWALGIVTLCLLIGDAFIKFDELRTMSQSDIAARLVEANDIYPEWRDANIHGKDFIYKLLMLDPEQRMTAKHAIKHDWFRKPARVAMELDKLYERANKFWSRRPHALGIVEELPDVNDLGNINPSAVVSGLCVPPQARRKFPDATTSPFFSLERHLQPPGSRSKCKMHTKRKQLLEGLKGADSLLIPLPESQRCSELRIKDVSPNDLFGTPIEIMAAQAAEAARAEYDENKHYEHFLDVLGPDFSSPPAGEEVDDNSTHQRKKLLTRSYSLSKEDQDLHDEVAKGLPPLTDAKAFLQALALKRKIMSSQELEESRKADMDQLHEGQNE